MDGVNHRGSKSLIVVWMSDFVTGRAKNKT